uniref:Uncharacterized protein n=1 Tax=Arundo donax TaxID=35708 RepID=A0A0A9AG95_ARUDO
MSISFSKEKEEQSRFQKHQYIPISQNQIILAIDLQQHDKKSVSTSKLPIQNSRSVRSYVGSLESPTLVAPSKGRWTKRRHFLVISSPHGKIKYAIVTLEVTTTILG